MPRSTHGPLGVLEFIAPHARRRRGRPVQWPPLKRRLLNLLTLLSLLLSVAVAALWVRSYWKQEWVLVSFDRRTLDLRWGGGQLGVGFRVYSVTTPPPAPWYGRWRRLTAPPAPLVSPDSFPMGYVGRRGMAVPAWLAFLVCAVLPACRSVRITIRRARLAQRLRGGLCARCGYDLRGTPGRCPECGQTSASARLGREW